jgi:hypothetical protein
MEKFKCNYFESENSNTLFDVWINSFPESMHKLDALRFANMVISILNGGENLEIEYIKNSDHKGLNDWMIDNYMTRYQSMKDMYGILFDSGRIEHRSDFV